jgi:AcrR family transcriptional regulator
MRLRQAVRLFTDRGYDATTVNEVAEEAGVPAMTVYRNFPTKEDLVLYDDFDQLAATTINQLPTTGTLTDRIGRSILATVELSTTHDREFLLDRLRLMITTPALQARRLDSQYRLQEAFVTAICDPLHPDPHPGDTTGTGTPNPIDEFAVRAAASACLGVANVALLRWAAEDGGSDLPQLFRDGFTSTFGHNL